MTTHFKKQEQSIKKQMQQRKRLLGSFVKARDFADFEILEEDTLIGYDATLPVTVLRGRMVLFVRSQEKRGEECFLVAEENKGYR